MTHELVHLFSDNTTAVSIFQVGRGHDYFIHASAREVWLTCATWDITLEVGHVPGSLLSDTADALIRWHLGHGYKANVDSLVHSKGLNLHPIPTGLFCLHVMV